MKTSSWLTTILLTGLFPALALAGDKSGAAEEALSTAGGIASPGGPTAVFQNPAGLVLNPGLAATAQAGASDSFNNLFVRAGFLAGGSGYGLAGGLTQTASDPSRTSAFYGLGVASGSGFSIGVAGQTGISRAGGTGINAGILFSGSLPFRLGITAIGINDGVNEWGAGISSEGPVSLLLDGAYNSNSKEVGLKPGIKAGNGDAALSLSYGFAGAKNTIELSDGFTAGASIMAKSANIQVYYNSFSKFYAAVTFML